ncbi:MAG: hypothetical protein ACXWQO_11075 [Bdellovibrionota bacterium]
MCSLLLFLLIAAPAYSAEKTCTCKCVVKEDGKYSTEEASGKDREAAGEKLKKALGKNTCELTPACTGTCDSDNT